MAEVQQAVPPDTGRLLFEIKKVIVGQDHRIERPMGGHRAPAKVQSALLEVMQERQVTIGRETHKVPDPFLVMATQNPIETEGTYALPEAQVDRFMLKVLVGYPSEMDEFVVVERVTGHMSPVVPVMTTDRLLQLQREVYDVFVDPTLMEYVVRLASATRHPAE